MPLGPRESDIPRLRTAVKVYRVSSIITGTLLLLLVLMMVFRWGFGVDIEFNRPGGPLLGLTPQKLIAGVNLSTIILIMHGWFYVLYLGTDFVMWRFSRYSFGRFLFIAMGGVIPLLSFFLETRVPRYVTEIADRAEAQFAAQRAGATA